MKYYTLPTLLLTTLCASAYADTQGQTTTMVAPNSTTATPATMTAPKTSTATPATLTAPKASTATPATMTAPKTSTATPATMTAPKTSTATPATMAAPKTTTATPASMTAPNTNTATPALTTQVLSQNKKIDCSYTLVAPAPSLPHEVLTRWASHAAMQTFTYDYKNVKTQLQALKQCYSPSGWESYTKALKQSGNVASTQKDKLSVTASTGGQAQIVNQKTVNNSPVWKISVPIEVVYKNSAKTMKQLLSVKLTVGITEDKHLGIEQIIASPRVKSDESGATKANKPASSGSQPADKPSTQTSQLHSTSWGRVTV